MLEILRNWIVGQGLDFSAADILARGFIFALICIFAMKLVMYGVFYPLLALGLWRGWGMFARRGTAQAP